MFSRALQAVNRALQCIRSGLSPEIAAIDLRSALSDISEVIGEGVTEKVLDHLFATFCLGK